MYINEKRKSGKLLCQQSPFFILFFEYQKICVSLQIETNSEDDI